MNSFLRPTPIDWADALPGFSALPSQDDIAANVSARAVGILELTTASIHSSNLSGDPENPLYESRSPFSTRTPWLAETIPQTRGELLGTPRVF